MASLKDAAERQAFSLAIDATLKSLNKDREKGLLNIVNLAQKFMGSNFRSEAYEGAKKMIQNPDSKWMRYVNRLLDETDPHVAKMTALNLGYQAAFAGTKKIRKMREIENCNIPWLILMDPTSACNLHCTGCWAAEYGHKLNLTFDETKWFFGHVYYDRAFNCHTIEEAVFYYAFRNNVGYQEALEIIDTIYASNSTIESISPSEISAYPTENYTLFVQEHISDMHSKEEIIDFLTANKDNFNEWNKTAFANLNNLVKTLIVSDAAKKEIHNLKRLLTRRINSNNIDNSEHIRINHYDKCGLIMNEILYDAKKSSSSDKYIYETINGKNVCSNTFILERLLSSSTGLPKSPDIPYIVRNNFPNKKVMSDILSEQKVSLSKSYDGIRKMIILLDFYSFWVNIKLGISDISEYSASERFTTYIDEANALLHKCGYEDLFEGNPYDWVFICSAKNDEPLEFFRSCVNELLES